MDSNANLRATLNDLIQTCKDGQEGFLTAAENLDTDEVKKVFNEYSLQRAKFTGELQSAAHALGDSHPEDASSLAGALHRGWINLKSAVVGRNRHAILEECERGEDSAVGAYKKALLRDIPADLRETIARQAAAIQEAHDRVKALRDASTPA